MTTSDEKMLPRFSWILALLLYLLEIILISHAKYKNSTVPKIPNTIVILDCAACIQLYFTLPRKSVAKSQAKKSEQLNQKYFGLSLRNKLLKYVFFVSEFNSPKK